MINVIQNGEEYVITFPYDYTVKELVKNVPGRSWNPDKKCWTIPKDNLGILIAQFKGTEYEEIVSIRSNEEINVNQELSNSTNIPNFSLRGIKTYSKEGTKLYNHQLDFLRYALYRQLCNGNTNGFLVCDMPGLGKSLESINLAIINKAKYNYEHCLIICCVNTSKYNWLNEIKEHTQGKYEGYILGTRIRKNGKIDYTGSSKDKLEDLKLGHMYGDKSKPKLPYFLIMNVEAIRMKVPKKKFPIADILIDYINSEKLNMIIVDEVHKNLSPSSMNGQQLLRVKTNSKKPCMWIPMTGTPIVNKPTDLFMPLRLINAHKKDSYYAWNNHFCVKGGYGNYDILGYKNLSELKTLLDYNMIRRLKEDVLDLPEKVEIEEYVENTTYQNRLQATIELDLKQNREAIIKSLNPLAKMIKLRQVNGSPELIDEELIVDKHYLQKNAKLQKLLEIIQEIVANNEKVVVFSNWVEPLRMIYKFLASKYKVCAFTGTMNEKDRQLNKSLFLNDPDYKIFLGTIGALGTTHTLTSANNIIFYDEPWTAADRQQAIDRCHRIGTNKTVYIHTLLSKNTVDERVHNILYKKSFMSKLIVDNQIDIRSNPKLFDAILGDI